MVKNKYGSKPMLRYFHFYHTRKPSNSKGRERESHSKVLTLVCCGPPSAWVPESSWLELLQCRTLWWVVVECTGEFTTPARLGDCPNTWRYSENSVPTCLLPRSRSREWCPQISLYIRRDTMSHTQSLATVCGLITKETLIVLFV